MTGGLRRTRSNTHIIGTKVYLHFFNIWALVHGAPWGRRPVVLRPVVLRPVVPLHVVQTSERSIWYSAVRFVCHFIVLFIAFIRKSLTQMVFWEKGRTTGKIIVIWAAPSPVVRIWTLKGWSSATGTALGSGLGSVKIKLKVNCLSKLLLKNFYS